MSSIYAMFSTDTKLEQLGVWLDYSGFGKFRVARAGGANKAFTRAIAQKMLPYRRMLQAKQNKPDEAMLDMLRAIQMEVFAETVVLGWEGVTDVMDEAIPFSKEAALKLFKDLPALFDDIAQFAQDITNFNSPAFEEDAKN